MVITMVAIGEGSKQDALMQIERLGARNIIVRSVRPPESSSQQGGQQRVGAAEVHRATEHPLERGPGRLVGLPRHHGAHPVADDLAQDHLEQVVLVAEELVEQPVRDAGPGSDRLHRVARVLHAAVRDDPTPVDDQEPGGSVEAQLVVRNRFDLLLTRRRQPTQFRTMQSCANCET